MNRAIGDGSPLFYGEMMNITWPLFWCLTPEDQAKLMQYQWDNYGYRLEIPPLPSFEQKPLYPSLEEIDKTMRQRPHGMKRVE